MQIVEDILFVVQALVSVLLVVVVAAQTTKNEGLSGNIGGQMTPSFKGKPGMEEQIRGWTVWISVAWFILAFGIALLTSHFPFVH